MISGGNRSEFFLKTDLYRKTENEIFAKVSEISTGAAF